MFWNLVQKELKSIIQSPKFLVLFITSFILILLSVYIGIGEYKSAIAQYETAQQLVKDQVESAKSWATISTTVYRKPDPMQIFSSGVAYDIGRYSGINNHNEIDVQGSPYSEEPIFAIFRILDLTFIVSIIFSLFALLFTYNSINGEREGGTLKLVFSNSVSRVQYFTAKFTGTWLGMTVPLSIPLLLAIMMVLLHQIPLSANHWLLIGAHLFLSLLYFTFFIVLGIFVSSLTRKSSSSFLILLVLWISSVFIIPRIGVMTAGQFIEVPSEAQISSIKDAFSKEQWDNHFEKMETIWAEREEQMKGMSEEEREAYRDDMGWGWMEEDEIARKELDKKIAEYSSRIEENLRNRKNELEKLGLSLARISPTALYNLAAMNLSNNDVGKKARFEDAIKNYKTDFVDFAEEKRAEDGSAGGMMISINSETGLEIKDGRNESDMDVSEIPKFTMNARTPSVILASVSFDLGLLFFFTVLVFAMGFISFMKYDVR